MLWLWIFYTGFDRQELCCGRMRPGHAVSDRAGSIRLIYAKKAA